MAAGPGRRLLGVMVAGVLAGTAACDGLFEVENISRVPADQTEAPGNAALLVNGAGGLFECALGAYIVAGGLIGEELVDATQTANRFPYDQRTTLPTDLRYSTFPCATLGTYTPLNAARGAADRVLGLLEGWTPEQVGADRNLLIARAALYAGYSLTLLGEGFCSGTISTLDASGAVVYGTELSRAQLFQEAETRFTRALAAAQAHGAAANAVRDAALVGRARVRLNLGRYAEARTDAAAVPASFTFNATASTLNADRQNRVQGESNATAASSSVGPRYLNLNDPRVTHTASLGTSPTGVVRYGQLKYATAATSIPIASTREAQLIVAEAEARVGSLAAAETILNTFRARGNQPAATFATRDAALAEVIEQRRRELFLEGHHLGDLIRFGITPTPAAGTTYHAGGQYGSQVCMPLPQIERDSNPNID
jgi:starch-binding outer membrane protein, SusD/RagB family